MKSIVQIKYTDWSIYVSITSYLCLGYNVKILFFPQGNKTTFETFFTIVL